MGLSEHGAYLKAMANLKRDNDHAPSDSENCQIKPDRISLGFLLRVGQYI